MAQTSIITGQYVRINQQAATLLQRGLAWLIDYIAIWFAATIILAVILGLASSFGISNDDSLIILMFVVAMTFIMNIKVRKPGKIGLAILILIGIADFRVALRTGGRAGFPRRLPRNGGGG